MRLIDADALVEKLKKLYAMAFAEGDSAYHSAYRSLAKIVKDAPTVGEWIPCSERLPEESNIYLCCNIVGDIYMHRWTVPFYFKKEGAWMDMYDDWPEEITDVVAWMPLPEPYKGGGTE